MLLLLVFIIFLFRLQNKFPFPIHGTRDVHVSENQTSRRCVTLTRRLLPAECLIKILTLGGPRATKLRGQVALRLEGQRLLDSNRTVRTAGSGGGGEYEGEDKFRPNCNPVIPGSTANPRGRTLTATPDITPGETSESPGNGIKRRNVKAHRLAKGIARPVFVGRALLINSQQNSFISP